MGLHSGWFSAIAGALLVQLVGPGVFTGGTVKSLIFSDNSPSVSVQPLVAKAAWGWSSGGSGGSAPTRRRRRRRRRRRVPPPIRRRRRRRRRVTPMPTRRPTPRPTRRPTPQPTRRPTPRPTRLVTPPPTRNPTRSPTATAGQILPTAGPQLTPSPSATPSAPTAPPAAASPPTPPSPILTAGTVLGTVVLEVDNANEFLAHDMTESVLAGAIASSAGVLPEQVEIVDMTPGRRLAMQVWALAKRLSAAARRLAQSISVSFRIRASSVNAAESAVDRLNRSPTLLKDAIDAQRQQAQVTMVMPEILGVSSVTATKQQTQTQPPGDAGLPASRQREQQDETSGSESDDGGGDSMVILVVVAVIGSFCCVCSVVVLYLVFPSETSSTAVKTIAPTNAALPASPSKGGTWSNETSNSERKVGKPAVTDVAANTLMPPQKRSQVVPVENTKSWSRQSTDLGSQSSGMASSSPSDRGTRAPSSRSSNSAQNTARSLQSAAPSLSSSASQGVRAAGSERSVSQRRGMEQPGVYVSPASSERGASRSRTAANQIDHQSARLANRTLSEASQGTVPTAVRGRSGEKVKEQPSSRSAQRTLSQGSPAGAARTGPQRISQGRHY